MSEPSPIDASALPAGPALPSAGLSTRSIRLAFVLPASSRRPELVVQANESVARVKVRLAVLERTIEGTGCKLIAQGRELEDEERVGECFPSSSGDIRYIHVVHHQSLPPIGMSTDPTQQASPAAATIPLTGVAPASPSPTTLPLTLNPAYLALHDTTLFLAFRSARALDTILGRPARTWADITPAPRVGEAEAARAVERFLALNGMGMGEAEWELKGKAVRDELAATADRGEEPSRVVNADGIMNKLVVPDPRSLSDAVVTAIGEQQHLADTIRSLDALQRDVPMYIPFPTAAAALAPTPTIHHLGAAHAAAVPAPQVRLLAIQLRLPLHLLPSALMSLIKVSIVLWMLTRHMRWTDRAFLGLAGAGAAWWVWECAGLVKREREREAGARRAEEGLRRARVEREAREARRAEGLVGQVGQAEQGDTAPAAPVSARQPAGIPELPNRRRNRQRSRTPFALALHGLEHERRRLRLFYVDPRIGSTVQTATDHRIPASDAHLPIPPSDPHLLWTWLVMPLYLFMVSATPPADAARKMAIRQREVHMRLQVQKLTQTAEEEAQRAEQAEQPPTDNTVAVNASVERPPHPPVLPRGLSKSAERYYRRVLAKGDTVDWEEEREAQAALLREAGGGGDPAGEEIAFF